MNERMNTLLYKNINLSHFIFERVMFVVWERWAGDRDKLLYWPKFFLLTIAAFLPHLGWGWSTVGHWRPKALSAAGSHFGILSPTDSNRRASGYIIVWHPLFFRLFTQVHLLIDGSVEGQYITQTVLLFIYN